MPTRKQWRETDRALEARSRAVWPAQYRRSRPGSGLPDNVLVYKGTDKQPALYTRKARSLADISRGKTATLPWRRIRK